MKNFSFCPLELTPRCVYTNLKYDTEELSLPYQGSETRLLSQYTMCCKSVALQAVQSHVNDQAPLSLPFCPQYPFVYFKLPTALAVHSLSVGAAYTWTGLTLNLTSVNRWKSVCMRADCDVLLYSALSKRDASDHLIPNTMQSGAQFHSNGIH